MGRAIVREPKVFCMDEPLSNLDAQLRVQTRTQIAELQRRLAVTTVYVTHDQVEAMTMGDRVAVMRAGQLQQFASPTELYDRPANVFVASLHRLAGDEPVRRHGRNATASGWAAPCSGPPMRSCAPPRATASWSPGSGRSTCRSATAS